VPCSPWAYQPRSVGDMSRSDGSKGARPRNIVIHHTLSAVRHPGVRCLRSIFSLLLTLHMNGSGNQAHFVDSWTSASRLSPDPHLYLCRACSGLPITEPQFLCAVAAALAKAWPTPSTHANVSPKDSFPTAMSPSGELSLPFPPLSLKVRAQSLL
jgi:hypothetical protein